MASEPLLAEHQSPLDGDSQSASEAKDRRTPEEIKTVKLVHKLLRDAKRARSSVDCDWLTFWKYFRGNQWEEKRPSYRHSEVINLIWSHIHSVVALLTDPRPNIETIPEEPSDFEFSEILTHIMRSNWSKKNFQFILAEAIFDGCITGTGIGHVPWLKELHDGLGDYGFETIDPLYCYPDPECEGVINDRRKCRYFVTAIPTDVDAVRGEYPEKAALIRADLSDLSLEKQDKEDINTIKLSSPIDKNLAVKDEYDDLDYQGPKKCLKIVAYLRDEEKIEDVKTDENGVEHRFLKKKWPNGRKIVIADGQVLEDGPNDDETGDFPYSRLVNNIIPRRFWGEGEVEQLKSPQVLINKVVSYVMDVLVLMGNPIWIVDTESGIDTDTLINSPGAVVEKNKGSEARREEGVQLQPFILQILDRLEQGLFDRVGGLSEASQGQAPGGANSGFAIDLLQEASQTKIRSKARNLDAFLQEIGGLMVNRILQKYTAPRIIRVTNNDNTSRYFRFSVNVSQDENGNIVRTASITPFKQAESGGVTEEKGENFEIKSKFDVRINTGTSLPFAKAKKANIARQLYVDQVIDGEDYLNAIDWPNKEQAIEKWKQRQQQAADLAKQQGQAGGVNPAPAPPLV